jgi:putative MATE family efflux protein
MAEVAQKTHADYTEGSIIGSILKMGLPSMLGFLTNNIYHLVDTWWVSRLPEGEAAVAALTFFGAILMLLFSFNMLVGPGSVAVISRRYGERNYWLAEKAIKETLILKLFFGFVFGAAGFIFARDLLHLVGARGEVLARSVEYGRVMFIWLGVPYAMYSIFTALRGVSNPKMAMFLMIGSNLLNMVLDPLFIFGYFGFPALGIKGAAVASVASFCITLAVGIILLYTGRANLKLHLRGRESVSVPSMWKLIKIGLPAWLGSLSWTGSRVAIAPMIATYGTAVIAAYGVGMQVSGFCIMIFVGIGLGLSSLIGHNLGGEKIERARATGNQAIGLAVVLSVVLGLAAFFSADFIMGLFFKSPETIAVGGTLLRIIALGFPAYGVFIMVEEIHVGVGLNTPIMIFDLIHSWALQVGPVFIVTTVLRLDCQTVWWIITVSSFITSGMGYAYYRRGRWLTVKV